MAVTFVAGATLTAAQLNAVASDTGFNLLTGSYASGWADTGSGYRPGFYRRVGKRVDVGGLVTCTSSIASNTLTTIATLPVNYRPTTYQDPWTGNASTTVLGRLSITTAGLLQWISTTAVGANAAFTITGHFFTD